MKNYKLYIAISTDENFNVKVGQVIKVNLDDNQSYSYKFEGINYKEECKIISKDFLIKFYKPVEMTKKAKLLFL